MLQNHYFQLSGEKIQGSIFEWCIQTNLAINVRNKELSLRSISIESVRLQAFHWPLFSKTVPKQVESKDTNEQDTAHLNWCLKTNFKSMILA